MAKIAARSGIPEDVVVEKMGIREKHVCPPDADHVTDMGVKAAREAVSQADVDPADLDFVCYHGSEYKDYIVWSAAADIAHRLGAENAYAQETYALCAGTPVTLRQVGAQLQAGDIDSALVVSASREEDFCSTTRTTMHRSCSTSGVAPPRTCWNETLVAGAGGTPRPR